jgi:PAS domain S-box-containing protein
MKKRTANYRIEGLREAALAVFGIGKRPAGPLAADAAMQAALKESEERLRLANAAAGIGTFTIDLETGRASYSPELITMLGLPTICSANIADGFARVHRDDKERFMAKYEAGLQGVDGGQIKADFRFVIPGGEIRWMSWIGRVDFHDGPDGRVPFRVAGACVDITERKHAEEALRESEERFRGIFDHAAIGIAITDLEGSIQSCNPACANMLGYTQEELQGLDFSALVLPEDREADSINRSRLAQQWTPSFEELTRYIGKDGKHIWAHKHVSLLTDAAGKPGRMLVLVTDVTERKQQEEKNRLQAREVSHRCKNLLSLVQAVARQTFATMPKHFMGRFEKRVGALAASHDLFAASQWKGAPLEALVRSQLAHFEDLIGSRIEVNGPSLLISARAAQTLGMALHELATNAGKYGALSDAAGGIRIEWCLTGGEAQDAQFELIWTEYGGPPVAHPVQAGFGTVLIEAVPGAELDADVTLTYAPEGFRWHLRCLARCVLEPSSTGAEAALPPVR